MPLDIFSYPSCLFMKISLSLYLALAMLGISPSYSNVTYTLESGTSYDINTSAQETENVAHYQLVGGGTVSFSGTEWTTPVHPGTGQWFTNVSVLRAHGLYLSSDDKTSLNFTCDAVTGTTTASFICIDAVKGSGGSVVFENLGDISFFGNNQDIAAISEFTENNKLAYTSEYVTFNNVGNITFSGTAAGGISFNGLTEVSFRNTGDIAFVDTEFVGPAPGGETRFSGAITINQYTNTSYYEPGSGHVVFENTGDITFRNLSHTNGHIQAAGISTNTGDVIFRNTGSITFENVKSTTAGSCIYKGNYTHMDRNNQEIDLLSISHVNGTVTFKNNESGKESYGGAIDAQWGAFQLYQTGDVLFENNVTPIDGAGAIFSFQIGKYMGQRYSGEWILSADRGDIVFKGNRANKVLRALYVEGYAPEDQASSSEVNGNLPLYFRAQTGREITFYDGLQLFSVTDNLTTLNINKIPDAETLNTEYAGENPEFQGTLRFTGELTESLLPREDGESDESYQNRVDESRMFYLNSHVNLEGGSFVLDHGACVYVLGDSDKQQAVFSHNSGTWEMSSGASLQGDIVQLAGRGKSTLRGGVYPLVAPRREFRTVCPL